MKAWGLYRLGLAAMTVALGVTIALGVTSAMAAIPGHALPDQIGFQTPVTEVARYIVWFHNDILMPIITLITLFVAGVAHLRHVALPRKERTRRRRRRRTTR